MIMEVFKPVFQLKWVFSNEFLLISHFYRSTSQVTSARKTAGPPLNLEMVRRSQGGDTLAEPTGIAIFKDLIYVVFRHSDMVMIASKTDTHDWIVFTTINIGVIGMVEVSNSSHHGQC
ncbi:hypothetical protein ElyMa_006437600 [Elysia marginata]|uniref:Sema domain-containing protein n=1 Tax=Elysia marginata TaxID=1093978 RepID=A0AAV4HY26_9GAST|nr:hypothetical protein ElyMa_006437600 [Elysia marginata]